MTPALRRAGPAAVLALAFVLLACDDGRPAQRTPSGASPLGGRAAIARIVQAERACVYTGYIRTIHGAPGEGRATRMKVARSASGRAVLEWEPGEEDARCFEYGSRFAWMDDPELLLRNYTVTEDAEDGPPIAWRDTRRVRIEPVRPGRPSVELLVDKETSLVLRSQMRDFEGRAWLTTVFDSIDYGDPGRLPSTSETEALRAPDAAASAAGPLPLAVGDPPAGFERVGSAATPDGGVREDWSDGLAAYSVIERRTGEGDGGTRSGELERRACSGRAYVTGVFEGVDVTVVGNLPAADLEAIVRSLTPSR